MENEVDVRSIPLVRRARWLEKRLAQGDIPGGHFDMAEYASLLWVFEKVGIDFEPAGSKRAPVLKRKAAKTQRRADDEPPVMPDDTFVPGEPRRRMFIPGGL